MSPGCPLGESAPVGCRHGKPKHQRRASVRRPRSRLCLRKGCGRRYQPRCWNQRYCQDPTCQREVRRWQAARRQARRRQAPQVKAQHAAAQRAHRRRAKAASQTMDSRKVTAARGHAAKVFFRLRSAAGRGAMNRRPCQFATRPATAATPAVRRYAMSSTVNANGGLARLWPAG